MLIPLSFFLYAYLLLLVVFFAFAFFNLYHAVKFSFWDFATFFVTFLFIAASVVVLFLSFSYIKQVDWKQGFEFNPPGISGLRIGNGAEQAVNQTFE